MRHADRIAAELNVPAQRVSATIALFDEGNTLPFIARYRKEITGGLDEEQLRALHEQLSRLRALDERRETVLRTIDEQGKLSDELRRRILQAETLAELEDLYRPYRPKRHTRAEKARQKGLQELADLILAQEPSDEPPKRFAAPFISEKVPTVEDALAGARDIVAETISDHPDVRRAARQSALHRSSLLSERKEDADDPQGRYELYYDFDGRVDRLRPHQVLAINRGEADGVLRVRVDVPEGVWRQAVDARFQLNSRSSLARQLALAIEDAAQRLLLPALERAVRSALTDEAEAHAIDVFARNVRALLNRPPLAEHTILGIDPAYRTGCKVAVIDPTGKVLDTATVYPHPPQNRQEEALHTLAKLIDAHAVTLIAIGNGTASRETEQLAADLIRDYDAVRYLMVNEAGASVYSASPLARRELPELDVSMRGAVSIARRVQDPLAELVKIDPRSIGVGMYQHDVNQTQLSEALETVVESVVNRVGVELNTASPALLAYVSGIGPTLARRIVDYRDEHGPFVSRADLKDVPGIGPKTFQQAAGFLRIRDAKNPLDATAIHPESYEAAREVLWRAGVDLETPIDERREALAALRAKWSVDELAAQLEIGVPTLADILEQLVRPGRDPRDDLPKPILRGDVLTMDDLGPGMVLKGTVRNVVDFGAFIDVGVKNDGLLHRSQIPRGITPRVGDVIEVEVLRVEPERGRISLGWRE